MMWESIQSEFELLEWYEALSSSGIGYVVMILKEPLPIELLNPQKLGEEYGIVVDLIKDYKIRWN